MTRGLGVSLALAGALAAFAAPGSSGGAAADLPRAPERLSGTGLFAPGRPGAIDPRNRPFSPQYPLWSDGAAKARWVFLPPGTTIDATGDDWDFPVGTRFWKEFAFGGRKIETRMLWRASPERWVAASYAWDAEGADAVLVPEDGLPGVVEVAPGRRHSIPSRDECAACHGPAASPLGFNPLQLSTDRDPNAIHGEPLASGMVTLQTLVDEGWLAPARRDLIESPPRIAASTPQSRAVLGYLSANCGSCHNERGEISASIPSLRYPALLRGDVARQLVGHATRWEVPGAADGASVVIDLDAPERSALLARMRSRRPSSQMPPLGTVLPDGEAIEAIRRWIVDELAAARRAQTSG